jgi:hypothetical protein
MGPRACLDHVQRTKGECRNRVNQEDTGRYRIFCIMKVRGSISGPRTGYAELPRDVLRSLS